MVSKKNFNRKINKLLVRIFQQGWYFYNQKRPNFHKMQKTRYQNFHFIYTLLHKSIAFGGLPTIKQALDIAYESQEGIEEI